MKYFAIFLLCCVAFAAAAPQVVQYAGLVAPGVVAPGLVAPGILPYSRTLVAGPTVVNGFGARYIAPGYVGPAII